MRQSVLLLGLAAFVAAGPAAASARFGGFSGAHFVSGPHMTHGPGPNPSRQHGFNNGGATALGTLQVGTFQTGPSESSDVAPIPPAYLPPPYYPAYYAPPRPCFRPLIIHITAVQTPRRLPRVVYGSKATDCSQ
jgi:hypothetical protein